MADIFQEVDEALQKERMEAFWRRWGPWLIAAAVAIVLITAAVVSYKDRREQQLTQATNQLMQARNADQPRQALSAFANSANNPHKSYARLLAAGNALADDDINKAGQFYSDIIADNAAPAAYQDLARVMAVRVSFERQDRDAEQILTRLEPVLANNASPWHLHARLQQAVLYGAVKGDYSKGSEILTGLINEDGVPRSLGQRARHIKHIYSIYQQQQSGDGA